MIKVLVVDDSATARFALKKALEKDPELLIAGETDNCAQTLELIRKREPDIVLMDVYLKEENGLDITKSIMEQYPMPILVISGVSADDPRVVYKAMERGALDVVRKLPSFEDPNYEEKAHQLRRLVKTLAGIPIKGAYGRVRESASPKPRVSKAESQRFSHISATSKPSILVIGSSTGGPPVVETILKTISAPAPVPIVVAQHISEGFAKGFADWLATTTGHKTKLVIGRTQMKPGIVYVAPDDTNIELQSSRSLVTTTKTGGYRIVPSVDVLFSSAASTHGAGTVGVVLTGMGRDGALGMRHLHESGAQLFAQEPQTCAVSSMAQAAIDVADSVRVYSPRELGDKLGQILGVSSSHA